MSHLSQMTGYSAADLLGQSARMLYESDEEFDRVGTVKYGQIKGGGAGSVETRWKRKDGSLIDILLSSSAIVPGDLSRGVVFSAIDISERRRFDSKTLEKPRTDAPSVKVSAHRDQNCHTGQVFLCKPGILKHVWL